jgi:hypothetical protein
VGCAFAVFPECFRIESRCRNESSSVHDHDALPVDLPSIGRTTPAPGLE